MVMNGECRASRLAPPFIVFDDDDWMLVYSSIDELLNSQEWPYLADEVIAVFDGRGRPMRLTARGEKIEIAKVDEHPDISSLHSLAEIYFARRTNGRPPVASGDPDAYMHALLVAHAATPNTRRKNRP